jgi:ribosomal protein S18 acetylase RimI-like enzyme
MPKKYKRIFRSYLIESLSQMIHYSDDITNNIIDHSPLEEMIDQLNDFKAAAKYTFLKTAGMSVSPHYTLALLENEKTKMAFYCLDQEFAMENCPSIMIYRPFISQTAVTYYILLICTRQRCKGMGYASKLLDGFIERVKQETAKYEGKKTVKIALSSVVTAVTFYETYGFRWTRESLQDHKPLMLYELYDKTKEYFILELILFAGKP